MLVELQIGQPWNERARETDCMEMSEAALYMRRDVR